MCSTLGSPAETQLHDGDEVGINFVMKIMVVGLDFICAGVPCQTTDDPFNKHRKNVCKREDIKCDIKRTYLVDLTDGQQIPQNTLNTKLKHTVKHTKTKLKMTFLSPSPESRV